MLVPSSGLVLAAVTLFVIDQGLYQLAGKPVLLQGPLDELAHVLTTLLIVWAVVPVMRKRQLVAAVVASFAIDVDHIPQHLGYDWLTVGTSRPYTHSLLTVLVILGLATVSHPARSTLVAVALGVASHLWRDLAEPAHSGVALLWPVSDQTCTIPSVVYLVSIGLLAVAATHRARRRTHSIHHIEGPGQH